MRDLGALAGVDTMPTAINNRGQVVGYGLAQKDQVQFMVARLLRLDSAPEPADAADALAIAICHAHTAQTLSLQAESRA